MASDYDVLRTATAQKYGTESEVYLCIEAVAHDALSLQEGNNHRAIRSKSSDGNPDGLVPMTAGGEGRGGGGGGRGRGGS